MERYPFNPYHMQPLASLNRRKIIALPGVEPELIGKTGYEVASKPALIALIESLAQTLGLSEAAADHHFADDDPRDLNDLLDSPNAALRIASEAIAACHGRRVGYLIASILLSPHGLSEPLDPWEEAYLRCWREQVGTLILGGGLANGLLGQIICTSVSDVLEKCGLSDIHVRVAEHPSYLPLIGAARSLPAGGGRLAVVADFGGTRAKRGLAFYAEDGSLLRLEVFPPGDTAALNAAGRTAELAEAMVRILAETVSAAPIEFPLFPKILCSAAAYVQDGKPLNEDRGG